MLTMFAFLLFIHFVSPNFIVNGDFEFPQVDTHDVFQAIPGWQGTANVEIGKGNLYNSKLSGNIE